VETGAAGMVVGKTSVSWADANVALMKIAAEARRIRCIVLSFRPVGFVVSDKSLERLFRHSLWIESAHAVKTIKSF